MLKSLISWLFGRRKSHRLHQPSFDPADYVLFKLLASLLEDDADYATVQARFCFGQSETHQLVDDYHRRFTLCLSYKRDGAIDASIHQLCGLKFDSSSSKRFRQDFDLKFPTDVSDKVWLEGKFTVKTWPEKTGRVYSFTHRGS